MLRARVGDIAAIRHVAELAAGAGALSLRAERALHSVAEVIPCDGAVLAMWDPFERTHRRLAAFGLPPSALQYCCTPEFLNDPGYRRVRESRVAHRRCDVPGAAENELVTEVLDPAGFSEGVTACLFRADRYTGVLNIALRTERPESTATMTLLAILQESLGRLVDVTQSLHAAVAALGPLPLVFLARADGCWELLERTEGEPTDTLIEPSAELKLEARRRAPRVGGAQAFLWRAEGELWQVMLVRLGATLCGTPALVVGFAPARVPLTLRELQVLAGLVDGEANPAIAHRLGISPHTAARHVEHVLEKLGVASRVQAAVSAVREGWVLAEPQ